MVFTREFSNLALIVVSTYGLIYGRARSVSCLSLQSNNRNQNQHRSASSFTTPDIIISSSDSTSEPKVTKTRREFAVEGATIAAAGIAALTSLPDVVLASGSNDDGGLLGGGGSALPSEGKRAPDFELENSRGNGVTTLNKLIENGKWTVLYFYPGAFTSGCTLEARGFQRDLDDYRKLNAQIVGISVDPVEKNAQFCTEEKLDFFMLSDRGGLVSKKYGSALSVPGFGTFSNRQTYIIDPSGDLRWIFTDVESKIARHSTEVLSKLTELEATKA